MSNLVKRNNLWPSTSSVDEFLNNNFFNWPNEMSKASTLPRVNIAETDDDFTVEMAAPGMNRDDFQVELDNDILTISAEMSHRDEENNVSYARREFSLESFKRAFHLPNTVEADKTQAKYQDGLLRLVIPKKEEAKRRPAKKIKIS